MKSRSFATGHGSQAIRHPMLLAVGMMLALGACGRAAAPGVALRDSTRVLPSREAWHVALDVHDGTRPRVKMEAAYMATFDRDTLLHVLTGDTLRARVEAELFDATGQPSAHLTADTLFYYERDRRFRASGRVVVTTEDGRRLETEHLTWLEADARVTAPGFVHIVTPTEDVQGYSLRASEDLTSYQLARVTAEVDVEVER